MADDMLPQTKQQIYMNTYRLEPREAERCVDPRLRCSPAAAVVCISHSHLPSLPPLPCSSGVTLQVHAPLGEEGHR